MSQEDKVLRTINNWRQFFKSDKRQVMLLEMLITENKWQANKRLSYEELMDAMSVRGSKCLHDTDKCVHNTRRDV